MNDRINEKVGAWLLEDGNTRIRLAAELHISRPALDKRLNGKTKWKWEEVLVVARLTGSTLDDLAGLSVA